MFPFATNVILEKLPCASYISVIVLQQTLFLEQLYVHSKTERKVQRLPIRHTRKTSPTINIPSGTFQPDSFPFRYFRWHLLLMVLLV